MPGQILVGAVPRYNCQELGKTIRQILVGGMNTSPFIVQAGRSHPRISNFSQNAAICGHYLPFMVDHREPLPYNISNNNHKS